MTSPRGGEAWRVLTLNIVTSVPLSDSQLDELAAAVAVVDGSVDATSAGCSIALGVDGHQWSNTATASAVTWASLLVGAAGVDSARVVSVALVPAEYCQANNAATGKARREREDETVADNSEGQTTGLVVDPWILDNHDLMYRGTLALAAAESAVYDALCTDRGLPLDGDSDEVESTPEHEAAGHDAHLALCAVVETLAGDIPDGVTFAQLDEVLDHQ